VSRVCTCLLDFVSFFLQIDWLLTFLIFQIWAKDFVCQLSFFCDIFFFFFWVVVYLVCMC
jgi:hypothetical protein